MGDEALSAEETVCRSTSKPQVANRHIVACRLLQRQICRLLAGTASEVIPAVLAAVPVSKPR